VKKLICSAILIFSMLSSRQALALPVIDAGSIVQETISAVENVLTAAAAFATEIKTTAMEAWDKSAWAQQLKGLWDSIQKLQKQIEEIVGLRDDMMNTLSGARDLGGWTPTSSGDNKVDYNYASQLPQAYLPSISCSSSSSGTGCVVSGTGYTGVALSGVNSANIRDAWRVKTAELASSDIKKLSNESAERYAQEIAIIQAMAQEAYTQANNRILKIEELRAKIAGATASVNSKSVAASPANSAWAFSTTVEGSTHSVTSVATASTDAQYDASGNLLVAGTSGVPSTTKELSYPATTTNTKIGSDSTATTASAPPPANRNDIKYIADLQAQIQVQQALLLNEQNKLAALAILQQSLRDAYEQRKKEIASYVVHGDTESHMVGRAMIATAQKTAYDQVAAAYR